VKPSTIIVGEGKEREQAGLSPTTHVYLLEKGRMQGGGAEKECSGFDILRKKGKAGSEAQDQKGSSSFAAKAETFSLCGKGTALAPKQGV